jgi:N-acetylmuramoyl-L-alanine amidase
MLLKVGSIGKEVRELQKRLFIKIDGIFGVSTALAVRQFQRDNKLKDDGIIGPKTWAVLLAKEKVEVKPTYEPVVEMKDLSDPEEIEEIANATEKVPTSSHIVELINLINKAKITRRITRIIYHCTATPQTTTVSAIQNYWKNQLGWKAPGYHILVKADGSWTQLQDFNLPTNGVGGYNANSIHVSYIGGVDGKRIVDNRTFEQQKAFETMYRMFRDKIPTATHHGHNEFSNKACPSFRVDAWIKTIKDE